MAIWRVDLAQDPQKKPQEISYIQANWGKKLFQPGPGTKALSAASKAEGYVLCPFLPATWALIVANHLMLRHLEVLVSYFDFVGNPSKFNLSWRVVVEVVVVVVVVAAAGVVVVVVVVVAVGPSTRCVQVSLSEKWWLRPPLKLTWNLNMMDGFEGLMIKQKWLMLLPGVASITSPQEAPPFVSSLNLDEFSAFFPTFNGSQLRYIDRPWVASSASSLAPWESSSTGFVVEVVWFFMVGITSSSMLSNQEWYSQSPKTTMSQGYRNVNRDFCSVQSLFSCILLRDEFHHFSRRRFKRFSYAKTSRS